MEQNHYIIRGGRAGKERLRVLSRVMRPTTLKLLERAGLRPGMKCLEVGCGSGDLAFELGRIVGPTGKVVATDIDGAQPCADDGKYADAVLAENIASRAELDRLIHKLHEFARSRHDHFWAAYCGGLGLSPKLLQALA